MNVMNKSLFASVFLLVTTPSLAASPASPSPSKDARYASRCQSRAPYRGTYPQGTLLWGTRHAWDSSRVTNERSSVLVSVDITRPLESDDPVKSLRWENGRLLAAPDSSHGLVGTVLQGSSSDGKPVEVAICGTEPAPENPELLWYRIEAWNPVAQEWENPCVATDRVPDPRALAVSGVWDASGAVHNEPGKLTLACENGAITKCIRWGYKPWAHHDGQSMAGLHQACTRMARADYCGNGRSHTKEGTTIDMYDRLGVLLPTTEASADWNPARASFEAAWAADGATCLARTRDGRALETILQECPGRFESAPEVDLGQGDRCTVRRSDVSAETVLLRNRSYEASRSTATRFQPSKAHEGATASRPIAELPER